MGPRDSDSLWKATVDEVGSRAPASVTAASPPCSQLLRSALKSKWITPTALERAPAPVVPAFRPEGLRSLRRTWYGKFEHHDMRHHMASWCNG